MPDTSSILSLMDVTGSENGNVFLNKDVIYVILKELEENNQVVYENEKFNSFHTYTRDTSVDDLNVVFEPNLKPMSFMDLVSESATNLYVMGHGNTRFDFSNRCY